MVLTADAPSNRGAKMPCRSVSASSFFLGVLLDFPLAKISASAKTEPNLQRQTLCMTKYQAVPIVG